jgi:hypothetical protein
MTSVPQSARASKPPHGKRPSTERDPATAAGRLSHIRLGTGIAELASGWQPRVRASDGRSTRACRQRHRWGSVENAGWLRLVRDNPRRVHILGHAPGRRQEGNPAATARLLGSPHRNAQGAVNVAQSATHARPTAGFRQLAVSVPDLKRGRKGANQPFRLTNPTMLRTNGGTRRRERRTIRSPRARSEPTPRSRCGPSTIASRTRLPPWCPQCPRRAHES